MTAQPFAQAAGLALLQNTTLDGYFIYKSDDCVTARGYNADITRCFPAGGRFSGPQKAVYEVVLAAQHAARPVERRR